MIRNNEILSGLVSQKVWHLITDCHVCVGSTAISDKAEDLSQYDPGSYTVYKSSTFDIPCKTEA